MRAASSARLFLTEAQIRRRYEVFEVPGRFKALTRASVRLSAVISMLVRQHVKLR